MDSNNKLKLRNQIVFIVLLVVLFMIGGHMMDVGDVIQDVDGKKGFATNGFFKVNASKLYHLGYYLMYISFLIVLMMYIVLFVKHGKEKDY